jgi:hypothetical protein
MRYPRRGSVAACSLLGLVIASVAPAAHAQSDVDRATARSLGQDGQKALDTKDYKTAEDSFRKADAIVHAPTLLLGLARALAGEGKLLGAQEAYRRIIREGVPAGGPAAFKKALDDATAEVQAVSPRIGAVTIVVKSAGGEALQGLQITWDDVPVNVATLGVKRPADPGSHVLHASADGYAAADQNVQVPVGGAVDAPLTLVRAAGAPAVVAPATAAPPSATPASTPAPAPAPAGSDAATPSSGGSIWPWVAFGAGGAGLVVGGIAGGLALSKHSDLASKCNSGCGPAQWGDVDSYNTLGLVSTVGFVVAGVGAAAGVTLLLLQGHGGSTAPATGLVVTPVVGPGSLGAVGQF